MPLVNANSLLIPAQKNKYAVGSFNVFNYESLNAIVEAAEEAKSPAIIAINPIHFELVNAEHLLPAAISLACKSKIPFALLLDHSTTVESIVTGLRYGFTAVMYDGSRYSFEENVKKTSQVVKLAKPLGVSVEAELGTLMQIDENYTGGCEDFLTDPDRAAEYVECTGVDCLAVAIGNAHGFYKGVPKLDFQRLEAIRERTPVPLVLHGGSGISDDDFRKAIRLGISKINFYTELNHVASMKVKEIIMASSELVNVNEISVQVKDAIKRVVMNRMEVLGSAGVCK